jgi:hypothetical protein
MNHELQQKNTVNPYRSFIDEIPKIRILNFVLLNFLDIFLPDKWLFSYSEIPLPAASGKTDNFLNFHGKLFLGRMISQKLLQKILKKAPQPLLIVSMQTTAEPFAKSGKVLRISWGNDLVITGGNNLPKNVTFLRFDGEGVFDHSFTNAKTGKLVTKEEVLGVLKKIHDTLSQGANVYVHCFAGKERSATLVIFYLMHYFNLSAKDAAAYVKKHRVLARKFITLKGQQREFLENN